MWVDGNARIDSVGKVTGATRYAADVVRPRMIYAKELPAVYDPVEAIQPGAPLLHDPNWVRTHKTPAQQVAEYPNSVSNPIYGASEAEVEAAMAAAPHVFEHEFHTPIQHQLYLELHCATVELDEPGVAHVWASNKAPYLLLDYLREGMGLTRPEVDV